MSRSFREINYGLRLGKVTERKMLLDFFRLVFKDVNPDKLQYIGMGSIYFSDFKLFHKELKIKKMVSIEEAEVPDRLNFNKPFHCIDIKIGRSTNILSSIEMEDFHNIIWMDYDGIIESTYFSDMEIIFNKAKKKSIYIISMNSDLEKNFSSIQDLRERLSEGLIPLNFNNTNLSSAESCNTIRTLVLNKIKNILSNNNSYQNNLEKLEFYPLLYFKYNDGAPMVTVGGIIDVLSNENQIEKYNLEKFSFINTQNLFYEIRAPNITTKEYTLLNSKLPSENFLKNKDIEFIPPKEKENFQKLYHYLPNFMEVIN